MSGSGVGCANPGTTAIEKWDRSEERESAFEKYMEEIELVDAVEKSRLHLFEEVYF